ncbi:MAG: metal ABC transporter ATP-binding protein [Bdellovibrionota bacterium]
MKAITVENLSVSYRNNMALWELNLTADPGQIIGIVGPNGSGKSTFLKSILGLIPRDSGSIKYFNNLSIEEARPKIAYVPQREDIDWDFPITALDVVLMGLTPRLGLFKWASAEDKAFCLECLKRVGLKEDFATRHIGELSGGQQQRVFIARALAQKADIYMLDEPFSAIDSVSEEIILHLFLELKKQGKTIFIVHHDLFSVQKYFDSVVLLNSRLVAYGKTQDVLTGPNLAAAYGSQASPLVEALQKLQENT